MDGPTPPGPDDFGGDLSEEHRSRIKAELVTGERLLWAAQSRRKSQKVPILEWGCGILAAAILLAISGRLLFVLFSEYIRRPSEVGSVMGALLGAVVTGIPGLLIVVGMIQSWRHRWAQSRALARTIYALTDRRAIMWVPSSQTGAVEVYTIVRGRTGEIYRVEYLDGSGDVRFGWRGGRSWAPGLHGSRGFLGVDEVRRVEDLVRRTLETPDPGGS
jgi:hypothetical protein